MIFDTTYTDKEVTLAINNLVGKPYSLWDRLKMGGIGSHRIIIKSVSPELAKYINPGHSVNYTNLELRPKGILIHLKWRTQTYNWGIPFTSLKLLSNYTEITDGTHTIALDAPLIHNESFFRKLESFLTN